MIKENELRIGSILNYLTAEGDICTATIDWQDFKWLNEDPKGFNMVHSVIKLTPEWLIKFGFKKIDYHRFKIKPSKFDWYYTYSIHDNAFRFYVEDTIVCLSVIFYVHQLQNLYLALNGEELEFNQH